jgi:hypothetical protein
MTARTSGRRARRVGLLVALLVLPAIVCGPGTALFVGGSGAVGYAEAAGDAPSPLLGAGRPVDWWFTFKFNTASFPRCGGASAEQRTCPFGGTAQAYAGGFGEQFVYASSEDPALQKGSGCAGETSSDPVGATFGQIYEGGFFYVIWNDQFHGDPKLDCANSNGDCDKPWGHSKGLLAWNEAGEGLVLQVSTPSWPAAGSKSHPRSIGNTLGCIKPPSNILVSQHFFSLKLTKDDLVIMLKALQNASVATKPTNPQIVKNGGPADVQDLVASLGVKSTSDTHTKDTLSSGVIVLSKPSQLAVPPWQMVSAALGAVSLRVATWWSDSRAKIYTTPASAKISCWNPALGKRGRVEIATTGQWEGKELGLEGGPRAGANHAKIGVSLSGNHHYAIFGDMNQEGALSGNCTAAQNGRGGLFFVVDNQALYDSVAGLIDGNTAPTKAPKP